MNLLPEMFSAYRTGPSRAKRNRMQICLHEAAHAVAFNHLCSITTHTKIFRNPIGGVAGICMHPAIPDALLNSETVGVCAGPWGETLLRLATVPRGRVKSARARQAYSASRRDAATVALYSKYAGEFLKATIDVAEADRLAANFVNANRTEIVALAHRLFRQGEVHLPPRARDTRNYQWSTVL